MAVYYKGFGIRDLPRLPAKAPAEAIDHPIAQRFREYGEAGRHSIAEPFVGLTTDGHAIPNLYPLRSTGVPTEPVRAAADAFLASLEPEQRATATFGVDDPLWQGWSNIHCFIMRHGVALDDCTETQR